MSDVDLPGLYRGKINLWVEDVLTREYLKLCWNDDPDILFLIAGGHEHVQAILAAAQRDGFTNVFGLVDRDFRKSNEPDWMNGSKTFRCFVPDVHEIENFLIDPDSLAAAEATTTEWRSNEAIEKELKKLAGELSWWMACREVIAGFRTQFREKFLTHPKCPPVDKNTLEWAVEAITTQDWYLELASRTREATKAGSVQARLEMAQTRLETHLNGDSTTWRTEFSGKELFRYIRGKISTPPPQSHHMSKSQLDLDFARSVAEWQVENNQIPQEVTNLRDALRRRVGLPLLGG